MEDEEKGGMTVAEAGRRGGTRVKELYGMEFYDQIGQRGGTATRDKHGREFYEKIGKKGGARVRALILAAKQAEALEPAKE
jgi:uncharacterized protein